LSFPVVARAFQLHDFAMQANGLSDGDEEMQLHGDRPAASLVISLASASKILFT
jgi:hypothetical protein